MAESATPGGEVRATGPAGAPPREIRVRPRTVLTVLLTALVVAGVVWLLIEAWQVVTWIVIAIFFAVTLVPVVDWLERRGLPNTAAVIVVAILALVAVGLLAWAFVPPLVEQTTDLIRAVPGAVDDLTRGRGPLGFLESEYHIVERAKKAVEGQTGGSVLGVTAPALGVVRGAVTAVVAVITIFFMTLFLLREGRAWVARILGLVPEAHRPRWKRVSDGIARTVRGYVAGNLVISLVAGLVAFAALTATGVPFAVPLALVVALLDLIPLVGATVATVVAAGVALSQGWVPFAIVLAVLVVYQQAENHLLQPFVYGRAVQLSPLVVLVAVLLGGTVAGVIGALLAIPVAGSLQVILLELLRPRREAAETSDPVEAAEAHPS
jgi:predicted PurR-regulated permease PerM